ncbi:hypothetical protein [Candidatus Enterovibrio altilux]|uniref:hypothetical protein n=1 Tax=Candidatus Enterovibrio altilux TaxID=1927128 RepID=UPI0037441335
MVKLVSSMLLRGLQGFINSVFLNFCSCQRDVFTIHALACEPKRLILRLKRNKRNSSDT